VKLNGILSGKKNRKKVVREQDSLCLFCLCSVGHERGDKKLWSLKGAQNGIEYNILW
jgi:hypothetical protein